MNCKKILEALLFASSTPLSLARMGEIVKEDTKTIKLLLEELRKDYIESDYPFQIDEIAKGYLFRSKKEFAPYLSLLHQKERKEALSTSSLEVLAIIAYKQPITRQEIDQIRGVDSTSPLSSLLEKKMIKLAGKLEVPGRPALYGTTDLFLQSFGLKNIRELPSLRLLSPAPQTPKEDSVEVSLSES